MSDHHFPDDKLCKGEEGLVLNSERAPRARNTGFISTLRPIGLTFFLLKVSLCDLLWRVHNELCTKGAPESCFLLKLTSWNIPFLVNFVLVYNFLPCLQMSLSTWPRLGYDSPISSSRNPLRNCQQDLRSQPENLMLWIIFNCHLVLQCTWSFFCIPTIRKANYCSLFFKIILITST